MSSSSSSKWSDISEFEGRSNKAELEKKEIAYNINNSNKQEGQVPYYLQRTNIPV